MRDLRVVFMGTPDFAVGILDALVKNNINVVGVITAPDKPSGRGRKLNQSAVKKYALEASLPLLQPTNLKNQDFIKELEALQANVQIVVAFRMLPKIVWQMPEFGTFNLHASLLPDYRGAAPIHWSIINGETKTGVSTFFIDEKIDTGEVILQDTCSITEDETVGSLHDKLMHLGKGTVINTLTLINEDNVVTQKQPEANPKFAPKLTPENTKIDWSKPGKEIYNQIRGLNPFPAAWTEFKIDEKITSAKIYTSSFVRQTHSIKLKSVIASKKELKVAVSDGFITIEQIKVSGKKIMDSKSLLNGFSFGNNPKVL